MPFGQPGKTAWDLVHHIMPFVWGAGGSELTPNRQQSAIASPQAVRGVKYFADLVPAGVFLKSSLEKNAPQVEEQFKGGQIATWIGGPWVLATVNRARRHRVGAGSAAQRRRRPDAGRPDRASSTPSSAART